MSDRAYLWLDRITGAVLLLVLAALVWMGLVAWRPEWAIWSATDGPFWTEVQVWIVLTLLGAALVLVSITALMHTQSEPS